MAFTPEVNKVPTSVPRIIVHLIDEPDAEDADGNPVPYRARVHILVSDQNGDTMRDRGADLQDHYTNTELQPLKDFMDQLRLDAESQLLA